MGEEAENMGGLAERAPCFSYSRRASPCLPHSSLLQKSEGSLLSQAVPLVPLSPPSKSNVIGLYLELETVREAYEERAAILEYDAGMSREEAEALARELTGYEGA